MGVSGGILLVFFHVSIFCLFVFVLRLCVLIIVESFVSSMETSLANV